MTIKKEFARGSFRDNFRENLQREYAEGINRKRQGRESAERIYRENFYTKICIKNL